MYENVLIPTDGGPGTDRSIDEGVGLASLCGATVHALYVVDTSAYNILPEARWLALRGELEAEGERAVAVVAERATQAGVDVETAVTEGIPHRAILEYADAVGADLIVMGTHGRTGADRFLLGSVTERVARVADIPVLVVRIGESTDSTTPSGA